MAKQYRTKLKSIYGGRSAAGRNEYKPDDILKGQTPKQHCEALIAQRGEGRFEKVSEHEDVCYLLSGIILVHRLGQSIVIIMMYVQRLLLQACSMMKPPT